MDKDTILQNLHILKPEDIADAILNNIITLDEAKANGRLELNKRIAIEKIIEKTIEKSQFEHNYWATVEQKNTVESYEEYLMTFPEGLYTNLARVRIKKIKDDIEFEKQKILAGIKKNPMSYDRAKIDDIILEQILNEEDFIESFLEKLSKTLFTNETTLEEKEKAREQANDRLEDYLIGFDWESQGSWKNLPPLTKETTDVYFIGFPKSGKSCVLQGILNFAYNKGIVNADIENGKGYLYFHELVSACGAGYPPPSTSAANDVNYISANFSDNSNKPNKKSINFVEMAGEIIIDFFNHETGKDNTGKFNLIWNENFLKNKNRKIFNFVFDYSTSRTNDRNRTNQQNYLTFWLNKLESSGILSQTDAIQIILTKTDLIDDNLNKEDQVRAYISEKYVNFITILKDYCKKYNINKGVLDGNGKSNGILFQPFSLGDFIFEDLFNYEANDSYRLLEQLLKLSQKEGEESTWISKLLNKNI